MAEIRYFENCETLYMKIVLLTHERELTRATNTGQWVTQVLADAAPVITWQRKSPSDELLQMIASEKVALVFPSEDEPNPLKVDEAVSEKLPTAAATPSPAKPTPTALSQFDALIIIDATWQEARKMYNRSPYLQALEKVSLTPKHASLYQLRRNQVEGGLCTAECAIEILNKIGEQDLADKIMALLMQQLKLKSS
ncbi:tRNA-uridine aminocarboxypropyltransferase [Shewanella sp. UCD-KL21]|uniref:tRNA-uridine aminocarboxypropyltransferase n=1 Tax=Shewanella sp. UCD-KL21 TaxID=1917164 RepID=UPI001C37593B|nr:tRNA-uridine aminocarboxypropyltransferase [Shewanella sp. UCD-KL21]